MPHSSGAISQSDVRSEVAQLCNHRPLVFETQPTDVSLTDTYERHQIIAEDFADASIARTRW